MATCVTGNKRPKQTQEQKAAIGSTRGRHKELEAPAVAGKAAPLSIVTGEAQAIYDQWVKWLTSQGVMSQNFGEAVSLYSLALADLIMWRKQIETTRKHIETTRDAYMAGVAKLRTIKPGTTTKRNPVYLEQSRMVELDKDLLDSLMKQEGKLTHSYRDCEAVVMRLGPEFGWSPLTRRRVPVPVGAKAGEAGGIAKFQQPLRGRNSGTIPFALPQALGQ